MYIKLTFVFMPWIVPQCAGGINVALKSKPEIVTELPPGAVANKHSKQLKQFMTQQPVSAGYFHDCRELSKQQIEEALNQFASHYNNDNHGLPGAGLAGNKPKDNDIIRNIEIALDNIRIQTKTPFLSENNANNGEELYERNFY